MENFYEMTVKELVESGGEARTPQRVNSDKAYKKRMEQKQLGNEHFIRVREEFSQVKQHLSLEQSGVLMFLMGYVRINEEGKLFKADGKEKGERLTVSEVAELIGKQERQTRKIISELETLSLIEREKVGKNVYVNLAENFFVCGYSEESFKFVKVYKAHLLQVAKKVTLSELGLLMYMLTHFHWKTHLLVDNPAEPETSKVIAWTRKHIAEEFNVSSDFVKRAIPKLRQARALTEVKSAKSGIVLHPELVCKLERKPTFDEIVRAIDEAKFTKDNFKK